MKTSILLIALFLNSLLFSQIIFEDNFDRTEIGSNWLLSNGNWSIEDNKLKSIGDGTYSSNIIYYANELNTDEITIDCKVMWVANGYFEDGIVCFHKQLNQPFAGYEYDDNYYCYLSSYDSDNARIQRFIIKDDKAFTFVIFNEIDTPIVVKNRWYNYTVIAKKNFVSSVNPPERNVDIKYYIDGKLILRYAGYADSIKGNFAGLGGSNGAFSQVAYYDDFKIYNGAVLPTDVNDKIELNENFSLSQNYPNPFNPTTTIEYELKRPETIKINIYDINGRLVRELINEEKNTGHYSINWDGKDNSGKIIASSTYFYQIQAGSYTQAKKMIFLK
jgi:hypothetical protein